MLRSSLSRLQALNARITRASSVMAAASESVKVGAVTHDKTGHEFTIKLTKDGVEQPEKAVLQYEWLKRDTVDLTHTGVPTSCRGRGIAKLLAQAAMDFVVEDNLKMKLSCTYLQKYLADNPLTQYQARVVDRILI